MAHLNWHGKIVHQWVHKDPEFHTKYHLSETNWLFVTTGPRMGNAKVVAKPKEIEKRERYFHMLSNSDVWESKLIY